MLERESQPMSVFENRKPCGSKVKVKEGWVHAGGGVKMPGKVRVKGEDGKVSEGR